MSKSKFKPYLIPGLEVINAGSEGQSIARHNEKVIMVEKAVPGDIIDAWVWASKRKVSFASVKAIVKASPDRVETFCEHFKTCGGCKWQQMAYSSQLKFKAQQVRDAFERIGKFDFAAPDPILGASPITHYRNKLEYTFTNRRWLDDLNTKDNLSVAEHSGLGYHIPGRFDKVFDVNTCHLMDDIHNGVRNRIKEFAIGNGYDFYDQWSKKGLLRNLIFRKSSSGEFMLILVFGRNDESAIQTMLEFIKDEFPALNTLLYTINTKLNDTIHDLEIIIYSGKGFITEKMNDLSFSIGPKSFFQTNSKQALVLYERALHFAGLTGNEIVYDLYSGVGTISLFVAPHASKVVGIEFVEGAVKDANANAKLNGIENVFFRAGDTKDVFDKELIHVHGHPDVVITDPPRAGMHEKVIKQLLMVKPKKIVYVSCNPATQARDIALLADDYSVSKVQPVDMFPHTHHVENIVLLVLKEQN